MVILFSITYLFSNIYLFNFKQSLLTLYNTTYWPWMRLLLEFASWIQKPIHHWCLSPDINSFYNWGKDMCLFWWQFSWAEIELSVWNTLFGMGWGSLNSSINIRTSPSLYNIREDSYFQMLLPFTKWHVFFKKLLIFGYLGWHSQLSV